jgi:protein-L-isoaspartate(D-aspartate) O-methyltransferase
MEAPSVLARLLQAAPVASHMSVLEVGAGSGYFSALLAKLSRRVVALERFRSLAEGARAALTGQGVSNVELVLADGLGGWSAAGPYQAIFVTGSIKTMPAVWIDQLAPGGKLIAPIGPPNGPQTWMCVSKDKDGSLDQEVVGTAFSIALEPGLARAI